MAKKVAQIAAGLYDERDALKRENEELRESWRAARDLAVRHEARIAKLEGAAKDVLKQLLEDGYHYPNDCVCALMDALGIDEDRRYDLAAALEGCVEGGKDGP